MAIKLSRRHFAALGAGVLLPDLTALAGLGKSAFAMSLPDVAQNLAETLPEPAPDFHFMNAAGRRLGLAHYKGEGLIVNFWATWCPPCRAELPSLVVLNKMLLPDGIRVLPISVDSDGIKAVIPYYKKHDITGVPMLIDPSSSALRAFQVNGIPLTVIVNRKGDVVASLQGAGNWATATTAAKVRELIGPPLAKGTKATAT
ncbi:TlpA disulfide reductase family protein [Acidiphilium acidophilum]|uniref:TlpA family protein disulfide reductase n=1 Tax=Acidiphilium acidophilum TaxID=76588 RepID=UPI002E8E74EB|nr:TlpA disulfide reductase family protein [Acidiphilium acidophilum]